MNTCELRVFWAAESYKMFVTIISEIQLGPGLYLTEWRERREVVLQVKKDILAFQAILDGIFFAHLSFIHIFASGVFYYLLDSFDDTNMTVKSCILLILLELPFTIFRFYYLWCAFKLMRSAVKFFQNYTKDVPLPITSVGQNVGDNQFNDFVARLKEKEFIV